MFQQRGQVRTLINAQTVYCQGKAQYPKQVQKNISKSQNSWKLLTIHKPINSKDLTAKVTVTAKLKESERICGAGTRGINFEKFKHKMANTLSVMTNVLRNVVSKQRIRYKENGYNLDLAYICDNIIAMGYPADNIESIFRNRLEDVYKFLQEIHQNHYKIYNLCLERSYDSNKFHGRVAVYPFEDHNPPTIELIQRFCMDVDAWLKADSQNVAAVHCKAGKGRTGTMICCYLLYSGQQKTAEDALECYAEKRTKDRKGVTIPSQRRYVQYFAKLIRSGIPYEKRILQFCEIRFTEANLLHSHGTVHCSISVLEDNGCSVKVMTLLGLPVDFRKGYTLDLKNHSLCVAGDIKVELTHKKKLFHFWFNTFFVRDDAVIEEDGEEAKIVYTLNKCEIDDAHKDKEHKCFSEDFKVQLVFYAESSMRPGFQANVSSIVSQISNNQRKSQNPRLSHQGSSGGGDSSSSSNCQLPQNSSSGSDLNYICDQKSSSSASASVSSFCVPLVVGGGGGGGGSGSIGGTSVSDTTNNEYLCMDQSHDGAQFMKIHQQQQNKWIPVTTVQQQSMANKFNIGCDGYDYDGCNTPYRRTNATATTEYTSSIQQQQQSNIPPHTYVNLEHIMSETEKQHLQQQQHQQTSATNLGIITPAAASNSFMLTMTDQQQNNAKYMAVSSEVSGFSGNKNIQSAMRRVKGKIISTNSSSGNSNRHLEREITNKKQSNGASNSNGCISANSSKCSINSQSSNSTSTASSASSAPISVGEHDCEEEDWESGECHPNMLQTVAHKTLQLSTLLSPSIMAISSSSDIITLPTNKTTMTSPFTTTTITHPKTISNPVSKLSSNFYKNTINRNSGSSYICSYSCCDDDENYPNIKCECKNIEKNEKLQKIRNERRSNCNVAKSNGRIEYVFSSYENEDISFSYTNNIGLNTAMGVDNLTSEATNSTSLSQSTVDCKSCENVIYKQSEASKNCDKPIIQISMASKQGYDDNNTDNVSKFKNQQINNFGNVVGAWSNKPLIHQRFNEKKFKACGVPSSTAIDVNQPNVYDPLSGPTVGTAEGTVLALSCSPASGCGGLASTSRRKLKNKLKNNTKKLSLWLQSHFNANPVEFCENFAQHTMTMRRNSNCSVGSRSRKLSVSSATVTTTPSSSFPKKHQATKQLQEMKYDNELMVGQTYRIHGERSENVVLKDEGEILSFPNASAGSDIVGNEGVYGNSRDDNISAKSDRGVKNDGVGRTKISLSESTTASNASLSSTLGGSTGRVVGNDGVGSANGSCDTFEDFYSSNCDNQLSFHNSPCKSPRSLIDIGGTSAYSNISNEPANSLDDRNTLLQMKRELNLQRNVNVTTQSTEQELVNHGQQEQLNVVVVAAKPAKTHSIGFKVVNERNIEKNVAIGNNYLNINDSTLDADFTITSTSTTTENKILEEKLIEEQDRFINTYKISNSTYMLDTKIDEVDEDGGEDCASGGHTATSTNVYFTPSPLALSVGDGDVVDGKKTTEKPFVFPNMQCELTRMFSSNVVDMTSHDAYILMTNYHHHHNNENNSNNGNTNNEHPDPNTNTTDFTVSAAEDNNSTSYTS